NVPQFASSAVIRETGGNGYLRRIEALDTAGAYTTVWQGTDPSPPGAPYSFTPALAPTALPVQGLRLTIDTDHAPSGFEEVDAVALVGAAPVAGYTQTGGYTFLRGGTLTGPAVIAYYAIIGTGTVAAGLTVSGAQLRPGDSGYAGVITSDGDFALPAGGILSAD